MNRESAIVRKPRSWLLSVLLVSACLLQPHALSGDEVRLRQTEGMVHGFLALRNLEGKLLADGELKQTANGSRVTTRVIFRFKDGSIYDDTTVFSQRGSIRLLNDHLVQKGPSFKKQMETWLDASSGMVKVRYKDEDGE